MVEGIQKVAVIGSGVMGAGIAAHCANAGCEVLLLDIVLDGAEDRNSLSKTAIQKMHKSNPEMLMHKRNAKRITPGNIEDDLHLLEDFDWVVEVVIENLDVKKSLYSRLSENIGPNTILSSNTSTLPRAELTSELSADLSSRFLITHFFNPPRYLPLLELVSGPEVNANVISRFTDFADRRLGKRVTICNDRPGFIGNRLGVYFIQRAFKATLDLGLSVEQADAMLGRPIGLPKTGVFALMDLVGIDLIPHVTESLLSYLPDEDPFHEIAGTGEEIVLKMIEDGYTGRKGKGGFYRLNRDQGKKVKEARDLSTGEYRKADRRAAFPSAKMGKRGLTSLMDCDDEGARLVTDVLLDSLSYAAYIVPDVSDDIYSIDGAMKVGYNWKRGPFEMMDSIGPQSIVDMLKSSGKNVPNFLSLAAEKGSFYGLENGEITRLSSSGEMVVVQRPESTLTVADLKRRGKPLKKNGSASIWDMGDEVLLVEYHTKMNAMDPMNIEMLVNAVDIAESEDYKGIVIGNDAPNFCAGANLGLALFAANLGAWKDLEDFITLGQDTYQTLKYCDVPVVAASAGLCLELLGRLEDYGLVTNGPMGAAMKAFETIGTAQVAKSAEQARSLGFLGPDDQITMNRDRLLADAKNKALELFEDYTPPEPRTYTLPGPSGMAALSLALNDLSLSGQATPHDVVVATRLAKILTGGDSDMTETLEEDDILSMEKETFASLLKNMDTLDRVQHMLETGKPLRN